MRRTAEFVRRYADKHQAFGKFFIHQLKKVLSLIQFRHWLWVANQRAGNTSKATEWAIEALSGGALRCRQNRFVGHWPSQLANSEWQNVGIGCEELKMNGSPVDYSGPHRAEPELEISGGETATVDVRRSEELYRMAFQFNPNALSVTRLSDGLYLDVNDEFLRAYGWARAEVIGKTSLDIRIWKRPEDRQSLVDAVRRDDCCDNFEAELVDHDGKEFSGLVSACLIMLSGDPCLLAITHDITERERLFNALREQKEFFHLIAENLSDFVAVLDLDGRRIYNSPSYRRFFGAPGEMRGSDSFVEVHPEDRERVKQAFSDTVRTGEGRQLEYRLVVPDGSVRTMESRGSVIRDREGRVAQVVVVARDITERKQIEEQVHQMAFHDSLTKLPNRRLFNDRLAQVISASSRSGYYGAVMYLDLDNFKPLNDRHGHDVGDLFLIEVAERLKSCVREMDTVARFGGDEFVVMISELTKEKAESMDEAKVIAEKIRLRLEAPYRLSIDPAEMPEKVSEHCCTASIGVVVFTDHEISKDKILKVADTAMYQAKESGRNSVRLIDVEPNQGLQSDGGD